MRTYIQNYFNQFPSPARERRIGFWTIVLPTVLLLVLATMMSSCSTASTCTGISGRQYYSSKAVQKQVNSQPNHKLAKVYGKR